MKVHKKIHNGFTMWYNEKEQLHREDGPAIESKGGYKEWFLNGKNYSKEKHKTEVYKRNLEKLNESI